MSLNLCLNILNTTSTTNEIEQQDISKLRIPREYNGIQINFCKNPECDNYGIPALVSGKFQRGLKDRYNLVGGGKGFPVLHCLSCNEYIPIKSNQGIGEELERMEAVLNTSIQSCPDKECSNHTVSITTPKAYQSFGKTKSGSDRYRCKVCKKTFAIGKSTRYQKQPEITEQVFKLLMNKSPFRRICEVVDIHPETLYHRINFLEEQCNSFASHHEAKLKTMSIKRLYLTVDRQDYSVNWSQRKDKRNNVFQGVATADNETRYVFAHHLNFDENLNSEDIELSSYEQQDYNKPFPYKRYARLWLKSDYEKSILEKQKKNGSATLDDDIRHTYKEQESREDVEKQEHLTDTMQLPKAGMQVHSEYTLYGHFLYLKNLLGNVDKFRFFLDQDSGMRAACLSAFKDEIQNRNCDAFFVSINKLLTVDEKRKCKNESKKKFDRYKKDRPGIEDSEVKLLMIQDELKRMKEIGKWKDKWLFHPLPGMSEPEKMVCYLTDFKDYDETHLSWLYNKASLHAVDNYFMLARRRVSLLERPIHSSSSNGRVWNGYGAYNPANVVKLLNIFRTFINFILVGTDKKTPAMRLGLTDRPYSYEEVISFV